MISTSKVLRMTDQIRTRHLPTSMYLTTLQKGIYVETKKFNGKVWVRVDDECEKSLRDVWDSDWDYEAKGLTCVDILRSQDFSVAGLEVPREELTQHDSAVKRVFWQRVGEGVCGFKPSTEKTAPECAPHGHARWQPWNGSDRVSVSAPEGDMVRLRISDEARVDDTKPRKAGTAGNYRQKTTGHPREARKQAETIGHLKKTKQESEVDSIEEEEAHSTPTLLTLDQGQQAQSTNPDNHDAEGKSPCDCDYRKGRN